MQGATFVESESTRKKRKTYPTERISEQKFISHRNWGACVDMIFWHMSSMKPMENGPTLNQGIKESILGLWARGGVASDWGMEGVGEVTSASYLSYFVSLKLGKFVSCFASVISLYRQVRLGLGYK